ncbi:MAG TPA: copper-translocating P-type ATPase [Thermoanaerobaculia bacterium]|jgi:Cu+-exporting ATPase
MMKDPVCGMTVDPARAAGQSTYGGTTYFFCSAGCKAKFDAAPEQYLAKDPVCGMTINPARAAGQSTHDGTTYYFCSAGCKAKFDAAPDQFVKKQEPPREAVHAREWTCPMHPEIVRDQPGACPICGMALEPRTVSLEDAPNEELRDMQRRLAISAVLTAPLLVIAMSMRHLPWVELALATPVVLWGGWPFFVRGWSSLVTRRLNMFTLIALGTGVAFVYSVAAIFLGRHDLYFEPAAVITTLVLVGQVLELRARERTSGAIKALLQLTPKTARVIHDDGHEHDMPVEQIASGMRIRLRPGERVPVDGVVIEGFASVDESMITGEPMPVEKTEGSKVTAGTVSTNGALVMRAERVGADTLLAQIVRMVAEAQRSRAPIQRLADVVSAWFVPAVIAVAIITFAAWTLAGQPAFALLNAVAVLIIACPCALGLATPMSVMVATGRGATAGILIRNAEELEKLARVDTLVVDKTGTLTEGRPAVVKIESEDVDELLTLAASLERSSEHPLAGAIVKAAQERGLTLRAASNVETIPGIGVRGSVEGRQVEVGRPGVTVHVDGRELGRIIVADRIKETTPAAVAALRAKQIEVIMLTGDARATAEEVAKTLGITRVEAEVMPAQKEELVRRLQSEGRVVAMAGDGVNDAPALSRADVGIAMGTGTDVAIESAGVTLVKGDLRGIERAHNLSEAMMRNVRQNLFFAFLYNVLGVPVAAGVLYPFFGVLLSPMIASAAMTFSSVTVIANALRLRNVKL